MTIPFVVPVLPSVESLNRIENEEENVEAHNETEEMNRMAALICDMEIEDGELLLDADILNTVGEEEEI